MASIASILNDPAYKTYMDNNAVKPKNELGKDDFLNLLIAQLKNQDPLNPMKDQEFISQLATFSSLEQMSNMNKNLERYLSLELLGKKITDIEGVTGVVTGVSIDMKGDSVFSVVYQENGKNSFKEIRFNEIRRIDFSI
jgi:flagellar hook assembly protein FlgD